MVLNRHIIALCSGLLLVLAQFAVTVHAAEHPFHAQDAWCEVVQAAQNHHADLVSEAALTPVPVQATRLAIVAEASVITGLRTSFQARAPPTC